MTEKSHVIITIDGPAGVGKTTLARDLAQALEIPYMDTGAMFRYIALKLGDAGLSLAGPELEKACESYHFSLVGRGADTALSCDGQLVGPEIRSERAGQLASSYATKAAVREMILRAEREIGVRTSLVGDGRDLGTVVFPHAKFKFFLDASPEVRAGRRYLQLLEKGEPANLEELEKRIRERDERDRNRALAPLRPAVDARVIDTSNMSIEEVLNTMLAWIEARKRAG